MHVLARRFFTHFLLCFMGFASACAGPQTLRPRAARALMVVGAVGVVAGTLMAVGCTDVGAGGGAGCSGGPGTGDLAVGIPVLAVGASMFAIGVKYRSRMQSVPATPGAVPVMPDPFVHPITSP